VIGCVAPYVGASLAVMEADTRRVRGDQPWAFTDLRTREGLEDVIRWLKTPVRRALMACERALWAGGVVRSSPFDPPFVPSFAARFSSGGEDARRPYAVASGPVSRAWAGA